MNAQQWLGAAMLALPFLAAFVALSLMMAEDVGWRAVCLTWAGIVVVSALIGGGIFLLGGH